MKHFALSLAIGLLLTGAARADMTWDINTETVVQIGKEARQLPISSISFGLKNNVLRIDNGREQPTQFINTANQAVIFLSYSSQTFLLTDFADLATTETNEREALRAKLPLMELNLANLPPEQRPEQQALINGQRRKYELWDKPYSVRATGEKAVVLDHPCVKYEGLAGGEVFQEIWVAEDITPDPSFRSQIAPRLSNLDPQQYQIYTRVNGMPIKTISHYGPVTVTATLTRYSNASIPADAFIIPDGFRETEAASKRNR